MACATCTSTTALSCSSRATPDPDSGRFEDKISLPDVEKAAGLEDAGLPILSLAPNVDPSSDEEEHPEGGRGWFVVIGAAIFASLVLGWPYVQSRFTRPAAGPFLPLSSLTSLAWGVFQEYYEEHNTFPGTSVTTLSFLGTVQNGVSQGTFSISSAAG